MPMLSHFTMPSPAKQMPGGETPSLPASSAPSSPSPLQNYQSSSSLGLPVPHHPHLSPAIAKPSKFSGYIENLTECQAPSSSHAPSSLPAQLSSEPVCRPSNRLPAPFAVRWWLWLCPRGIHVGATRFTPRSGNNFTLYLKSCSLKSKCANFQTLSHEIRRHKLAF